MKHQQKPEQEWNEKKKPSNVNMATSKPADCLTSICYSHWMRTQNAEFTKAREDIFGQLEILIDWRTQNNAVHVYSIICAHEICSVV